MLCRWCQQKFELNQLKPFRNGMVEGTSIKKYGMLCKDCYQKAKDLKK